MLPNYNIGEVMGGECSGVVAAWGQKPSQNCAVQLVEKVFIHSFQLIELALFQMTMASSKSER